MLRIQSMLACVAGGIFGTQEVKFFGGGAANSERQSRENSPCGLVASSRSTAKTLYRVPLYNTASYAG